MRRLRFRGSLKAYQRLSTHAEIFDKVYEDEVWLREPGGSLSGDGSSGPWLDACVAHIESRALLESRRVLEIGCGDFSFGSRIFELADTYTALDVSSRIIRRNQELFGERRGLIFLSRDATCDPLPEADVVIVRQVLQHLPNAMIERILSRVEALQPETTVVFEGLPAGDFEANIDLETAGPFTRQLYDSGVDPSKAPFDRPFVKTAEWLHPEYPSIPTRLACFERR